MHSSNLRKLVVMATLLAIVGIPSGCKKNSTTDEKETASASSARQEETSTNRVAPKSSRDNATKTDPKMAPQKGGAPKGKTRKGGRRKAPGPTPQEKAVLALAKRVGGNAERIPGGGGPPGALAFVELPGDKGKNEDLKIVAALPTLVSLRIESPGFSDEGMPTIAAIPSIGTLHLIGNSFTDKGVALLAGHKKLRILILDRVAIGTPGLAALAKNESLEFVDLVDIPVTAEVLAGLKQLRMTRELRLIRSRISAKDQEALKEQLPDCDVLVTETESQ